MTGNLIHVLILDDQLVQRTGIAQVVQSTGTMTVVGTAGTADEAMQVLKTGKVDLALVDLVLGEQRGTVVGRKMRQFCPALNVVIYTRENSMVLAADILRERKSLSQPGLQGYILTRNISSSSYLRQVVRQIAQNGHYIDPDVLRCHYQLAEIEPLTPREKECALLVARGFSNEKIARHLVVSRRRVENLVGALYAKFNITGHPGDPARRVLLAAGIRQLCSRSAFSRRVTVLLIEDDVQQLDAISHTLDSDDRFDVVAKAASGRLGIDLALACHPKLVLTDVSLADITGFQVARQILRELPETKVIMNSSDPSQVYEREAQLVGAIALLPKKRVSADIVYELFSLEGD